MLRENRKIYLIISGFGKSDPDVSGRAVIMLRAMMTPGEYILPPFRDKRI
jgi:hypothetical protein